MRVSSVLFCDFPPSLLCVRGTLLNCYSKSSSLAVRLTSRKTLFSSILKGSFPLEPRKWNHRGLLSLAFGFFFLPPRGMRSSFGACERLRLFTLSPVWSNIKVTSSCDDFETCPHRRSEQPQQFGDWDMDT